MTETCDARVWRGSDWSGGFERCGKPIKRRGLCGVHARKEDRRDAEQAQREAAWEARETLDALAEQLTVATGVRFRSSGTRFVQLDREAASDLLARPPSSWWRQRRTGMSPRIGSLFSGAAGLDMAVEAVTGGTVAWHAEVDPAASKVLAYRFPGVPNHGDVTAVDWRAVEPVDVICGGSPCQDVSHAGRRAGMRAGTRSGLWASMVDAIDVLRPRLVCWENVRGVLSAEADSALEPCAGCVGDGDDGAVLRALGRVLGDLAELGYDARWCGLRAADVGAPHGRFRVFVVATPCNSNGRNSHRWPATGQQGQARSALGLVAHADIARPQGRESARRRNVPARRSVADTSRDGRDEGWPESAGIVRGSDAAERGATPADTYDDAARPGCESGHTRGRGAELAQRSRGVATNSDCYALREQPIAEPWRSGAPVAGLAVQWGHYEPAIHRWEHVTGRPAPAPTEPGPRGGQRLSPRLTEWMMGWPDGWVTDVPGITRNDALKLCGNGVVPQQAAEALRRLLVADERAA